VLTRQKPTVAQIKSSLSINLDGRYDDGLSIHCSIGTRLIEVLSVITVVSELEIEVELELYGRISRLDKSGDVSKCERSSNVGEDR